MKLTGHSPTSALTIKPLKPTLALMAAAPLVAAALLFTLSSHADVRVWTGEETVILKGDLKGMEVLPSGSALAERRGEPLPAAQVSAPAAATGSNAQLRPPQGPTSRAAQPAAASVALPSGLKPLPSAPRFASQQMTRRPVVAPSADQLLAPPPQQQPAAGTGRVLRVGPGGDFALPSEAAKVVRDGDRVEIEAGEYFDCATWQASNILLIGVNGQPQLKEQTCRGKAIWITHPSSRNVVVENIAFSGMKVPSLNGAGIRHEGNGLTLRNVYMHDGESGLLTGNDKYEDDILIENSLFERLGNKGQAHPIYVGSARSFTLKNSVVRNCMNEANCVKTRAYFNHLSCNVVDSATSPSSWELELSLGGNIRIENNTIVQGPASENNNIVGYAMEYRTADPRRQQQLSILNNIFINDHAKGTFLNFREPAGFAKRFSGNFYVGKGALMKGAEAGGGRRYANRKAAGLPAMGKPLPLPVACSG